MKKEISNYVPINRKFFDNPFWTKDRVYSEAEAWLWLIKEARFEVSEGSRLIGTKVIKWKRGEIPASLRYLAGKWTWGKNRVDRFLELLVSEGMIAKRTQDGTDQTIITLCNYDSYNSVGEKSGQDLGQMRDTSGTLAGQVRDNTKKVNNGNKEREGADAQDFQEPHTLPVRPKYAPTYEEALEYFYQQGHPDVTDAFMRENDETKWVYRDGSEIIKWKAWAFGFIKRHQKKIEREADQETKVNKKKKTSGYIETTEDKW